MKTKTIEGVGPALASDKYLTMGSRSGVGERPGFVAFAVFRDVNTPPWQVSSYQPAVAACGVGKTCTRPALQLVGAGSAHL